MTGFLARNLDEISVLSVEEKRKTLPNIKLSQYQYEHLEETKKLIPDIIQELEMENRAENFVEVLRSIKKGNMKDNIHFQMLLDVGRRIKQKNPRGKQKVLARFF